MLFLDHELDSCRSGIVLKVWVWLQFGGFMIKVALLSSNPKGLIKSSFFSQRTDGSINPRYESLITVDYKYKEILHFAFLDVNLWLKEMIIKF